MMISQQAVDRLGNAVGVIQQVLVITSRIYAYLGQTSQGEKRPHHDQTEMLIHKYPQDVV